MLTSLKFCAGSVAKKDFVIELKHFAIKDGRVRGFNGNMALSSPIPFDIDCKPHAEQLVKAVGNCIDVIQLSLTKAGRLNIKSGVFKAFIDCVDGDHAFVEPEGELMGFDGDILLAGLKAVAPFIGSDASRPWANGILIRGESMFATNNVMLVEYWLGSLFPCVVNIPRAAVKEMLRINEPPTHAQVCLNSITFYYSGDRWLRTQLYTNAWPDLAPIINKPSTQIPLDPMLFVGLDAVKAFTDKLGIVIFGENQIRTHQDEQEGAGFAIDDFTHEGKYNIDMLYLLRDAAKTIDWSNYPKPCAFQGDRLRGVMIGMKK
jgi:hypothetical protein